MPDKTSVVYILTDQLRAKATGSRPSKLQVDNLCNGQMATLFPSL